MQYVQLNSFRRRVETFDREPMSRGTDPRIRTRGTAVGWTVGPNRLFNLLDSFEIDQVSVQSVKDEYLASNLPDLNGILRTMICCIWSRIPVKSLVIVN